MQDCERNTKILLVEDEEDIQKVLSAFLEFAGFEVSGVSNGREAIRVIPEFSPDLIVLDLMMQPIDGWEVLNWLRANQISPPPPVLVITALTNITDQMHGFEEGAIEYLTKPTQPSKIVDRIRTLLSLSVEQRIQLRHQRINEQRLVVDRLNAPQPDEFVY